jgi:hypothetical protein
MDNYGQLWTTMDNRQRTPKPRGVDDPLSPGMFYEAGRENASTVCKRIAQLNGLPADT